MGSLRQVEENNSFTTETQRHREIKTRNRVLHLISSVVMDRKSGLAMPKPSALFV
jgi:hypothetical protein